MWITGHDKETILQMYNDYRKSPQTNTIGNAMKFLLKKEKQRGVPVGYWAQIEVVNMMKEYAESQLSAVPSGDVRKLIEKAFKDGIHEANMGNIDYENGCNDGAAFKAWAKKNLPSCPKCGFAWEKDSEAFGCWKCNYASETQKRDKRR